MSEKLNASTPNPSAEAWSDLTDYGVENISEPEMNSQKSISEYGDTTDYGVENISEPGMNSQSSAHEYGDQMDYGHNVSEPWISNQPREFNEEDGKFHTGGEAPSNATTGDFGMYMGESDAEFVDRMKDSFGDNWAQYAKDAYSNSSSPVPKDLENILGWTNVTQKEPENS